MLWPYWCAFKFRCNTDIYAHHHQCHTSIMVTQSINKAAFTQGAVLLQCSAALRCLAVPCPLDLLHRELLVSGSGSVANGVKGPFTQGTAWPGGGLVPKRAQRRQQRRRWAHGPNSPHAAKLPQASVKMPVEINWIQLTVPQGSAAPRHAAAKQRPV